MAVYLATLISWLNTDPWPQDNRFGGPVADSRGNRAEAEDHQQPRPGEQDLDADDLARRCARLVVLGGPGSGKTWLARRTARLCAEAALDALAAGAGLDEVELPLYTTCARLSAAPPGDDIRRAVVSSALGQLPDLGGTRISDALRVLFEERNAPTLLVADSLDEARGADDRIRQADTLPRPGGSCSPAGRLRGTASSPSAMNDPLTAGRGACSRCAIPMTSSRSSPAGSAERPAWGADLSAQLRNRPALQQAATVPLILAFYCIVGGDQPLPSRRADLYAKVIRRMLTGRWRGSGDRDRSGPGCVPGYPARLGVVCGGQRPVSGIGDLGGRVPHAARQAASLMTGTRWITWPCRLGRRTPTQG